MNWVDWLIILFVFVGLWQGFWQGFVALLFQLVSLILATLVAFWTLPRAGNWMEQQLHVPVSYARPFALFIVFMFASTVFGFIGNILHKLLAPILRANPLNRLFGAVLGAVRQLLIAGVILVLLETLPLSADLKNAVDNSNLAKPLVAATLRLEQQFEKRLDKDQLESVAYRIVSEDDKTTTALNYSVDDPKLDLAGEAAMLKLTNETRKKAKVAELKHNAALQDIARVHARNMLNKGYFSHYEPNGDDVSDRAQKANITYLVIGENLASAPTVVMAHGGLLASEGHRKNILNPEFNQVGIGVYDAGSHGKMIVEVFAKMP